MLKNMKRILSIAVAVVVMLAALPLTTFVFADIGEPTTYDYTDLTALPLEGQNSIPENIYKREYFPMIGAYDASFNTEVAHDWAAALQRGKNGAIRAGWYWLRSHEQGTLMPYIAYCVAGGTEFKAKFWIDNSDAEGTEGGKQAWESLPCYAGKKFEFKLQSSSDFLEWKDVASTGDRYDEFELSVTVDEDANFIRVVFPQDGNANGKDKDGAMFNHKIELRSVSFVKSEMKYTNNYKYTDLASIPLEKTTRYISDMYFLKPLGAYSASFNEESTSVQDAALVRGEDGSIHPGDAYLRAKGPGEAAAYLVYSVKSGTPFRAQFEIDSDKKTAWEALAAHAGKKLEAKIQTSADGENWTDSAASGDESGKVTLELDVPESDRYVRILFPQNGNPNGKGAAGEVFADAVKLTVVSSNAGEGDAIEGYYDYLDLKAIPVDGVSGTTGAIMTDYSIRLLGAYAASINTKYPTYDWAAAIERNTKDGSLRAGYFWLSTNPQGTVAPHIDYHVKGGTAFRATFNINEGGKTKWEALPCYEGRKFEFKIQTSKDGENWTDAASTGDKSGVVSLTVVPEADADYVRILFPQDGKPATEGAPIFNDMAMLYSVMCQPKETTINYLNLQKNPVTGTGIYHPGHFVAYGAYSGALNNDNLTEDYSAIQRMKSGALTAGYGYLLTHEQGTVMPYITYRVKGGTTFTATLNINNSATAGKPYWESLPCYEGKKFEFKLQSSTNGTDWTDIAATGDSSGIFVLSQKIAEDAQYVRIVFPQDGNPHGVNKGGVIFNDMAQLYGVSFEKADDPTYAFSQTVDFTQLDIGKFTKALRKQCLMSASSFEGLEIARMQGQRHYLGVSYEYIYRYTDVARLYIVYNTVPGTAFQATYKYVAKTNNVLKKALNGDFRLKLYVSSDKSEWKEVETTTSYIGDKQGNMDVTEVQTIERLGDGVKYVKVEFPQNGNMADITDKAVPSAGNDFIGLECVSFTKGNDDPVEDDTDDGKDKEVDFIEPELPDDGFDTPDNFPDTPDIDPITDITDIDEPTVDEPDDDSEKNGEKKGGKQYKKEIVVETIPYTTLEIVLMCAIPAVVVAGAAVATVIIVKKRRQKKNQVTSESH